MVPYFKWYNRENSLIPQIVFRWDLFREFSGFSTNVIIIRIYALFLLKILSKKRLVSLKQSPLKIGHGLKSQSRSQNYPRDNCIASCRIAFNSWDFTKQRRQKLEYTSKWVLIEKNDHSKVFIKIWTAWKVTQWIYITSEKFSLEMVPSNDITSWDLKNSAFELIKLKHKNEIGEKMSRMNKKLTIRLVFVFVSVEKLTLENDNENLI